MNDQSRTSTRIAYLDILRVIASFAVIVIHVSSQHLADVDAGSYQWRAFMTLRDLTSFAVPVFVMISGTIFSNVPVSGS